MHCARATTEVRATHRLEIFIEESVFTQVILRVKRANEIDLPHQGLAGDLAVRCAHSPPKGRSRGWGLVKGDPLR